MRYGLLFAPVALGVLATACIAQPDGTPSDGRWSSTGQAQTVCAAGPTVKGVDVSHWQGTIDWQQAKGTGIKFAFMKATEGTTFVDPEFSNNWAGAKQQGILRGAYHFFRAGSDGVAQAQHFVNVMGPLANGDLPPVLDLETMDGQSSATVIQRSKDFMAEVEKLTGRTPAIYSGGFFKSLGSPSGFSQYYLWDAHWGVTCPNIPDAGWSTWTFWQYTDQESVAGIGNAVDGDEFNGTLQDLIALASPGIGGTGGTAGAGGMAGAGGIGAGGVGGMAIGGAGGVGAGGTGGAAGQMDAGAGARQGSRSYGGDSGGCGCGLPGSPGDAEGWLALAALGAVVVVRRRRRARG